VLKEASSRSKGKLGEAAKGRWFQVRHKPAEPEALADAISSWIKDMYPTQPGIVYALTRKDCETLAADLRRRGIACAFYHADMDPSQRERAHQKWAAGGHAPL
jgi:ATP-dependent DNA helicase Q1